MHTPMLVEEVVKDIANSKHSLTLYGSGRPYGVSFMWAGFDRQRGFQLYCSDPSGNYAAWNAHSTGVGSVNVISALKDDYKEDCNLTQGITLALTCLSKGMDHMKPTEANFEVGVLHRDAKGNVV